MLSQIKSNSVLEDSKVSVCMCLGKEVLGRRIHLAGRGGDTLHSEK